MASHPQGLSLHVASLDFFTSWLGKKKEEVEAAGLLSSGTPSYRMHLTKASGQPSDKGKGDRHHRLVGDAEKCCAMISNVPNIPIAFSGASFIVAGPALPAEVSRL